MNKLEQLAEKAYQSFVDEQEAIRIAEERALQEADSRDIKKIENLLKSQLSESTWEALQECHLKISIEEGSRTSADQDRAFAIFSYLGHSITLYHCTGDYWLLKCDNERVSDHEGRRLEQHLLLTLGHLKHTVENKE